VDGITFAAIEASVQEWLADLREELISKTYRPDRHDSEAEWGRRAIARHSDHPGSCENCGPSYRQRPLPQLMRTCRAAVAAG
jgi:hypothetical protein